MADTLRVDVPAIRAVASGMRSASAEVPTGSPLDVAGCGSSAVIAAAESFNMWAKVSGQVTAAKLDGAAKDADAAATAFETLEAQLAAGATH